MHHDQLGTEVKCDTTVKKTKQWDPLVNLGKNFLKKSVSAGFLHDSDGKESACSVGDLGSIPGWEDPLEKRMATHSSILAWRIPRTEEPGRIQSMGL